MRQMMGMVNVVDRLSRDGGDDGVQTGSTDGGGVTRLPNVTCRFLATRLGRRRSVNRVQVHTVLPAFAVYEFRKCRVRLYKHPFVPI